MGIRKHLALTAGAALVGGGLLFAPGASAAPAATASDVGILSCSHSWSNKDAGYGTMQSTNVNLRVGPHTSCGAVGQVQAGQKVYYHCYTTTVNDGTWTHLRISGTQRQGWVKDTLLPGGGSTKAC
ncbi:SH3 domain-containing protein [Streptomyces sp. NPDC014734]|uniref:SH3 domain-containing protein n=1 Tax=Streptomyces sp. NPDC014734 TaxID=3364886 RepID=UPI00370359B9